MKIGIVTFFCVPNYGAMLQAYVLWHTLMERGHKVEFVDYSNWPMADDERCDAHHLNHKGAVKFTKEIINQYGIK